MRAQIQGNMERKQGSRGVTGDGSLLQEKTKHDGGSKFLLNALASLSDTEQHTPRR
jgi:hypothetical protein